MKLYYDFHIHSCLSPCGDRQMTPANIAGMAFLAGLDIAAVADHNTARHCRVFAAWAERYGILAVPALELNTREDAHILCLFPDLESAEDFDVFVHSRLPDIKNRPDFFGEQLILDEDDQIVGREELLLTAGADISVYDIAELMEQRGGIAIPAHIDRPANSVPAHLGFIAEDMHFDVSEITRQGDADALLVQNPALAGKPYITNSDAHYLHDLPDKEYSIEVQERTPAGVIVALRAGFGLSRL